ncbi:NCS1 family nucleobase:cation symporter-1 [Pantoea sp. Mhis]|uniref:NCS1 family nucleobase:cation symporter-1 n=1 Tax=Pantoea sp. Mhis TaxID=2576759 RepID=UPI00135A4414|nr:NCS1 family nucleobase:cation symporter-1 [Pantoea sp. Mhis]MXP56219.1 NCS1 family nucleobase:cation symporter-1 [Pantoea sp. Mhis]
MDNHNKISITNNCNNLKSYSPLLYNKNLAPIYNQNWSWYNIVSFWISNVHSISWYIVTSSFFNLGLKNWQILLCLIIGIIIVQLSVNLIAKPSQISGLSYAVISRQAFGVFGANIPVIIHGIIAFIWYGIQTYLAANALMIILLRLFPHLDSISQINWLGLSCLGWCCFSIMWFLQIIIFWQGVDIVKRFLDISGPAVYIIMILTATWMIYKIGFNKIQYNSISTNLSPRAQIWQMITVIALVVSYFSGQILNFGNFSCYVKNMKEVRYGNFLGLPINLLLFSIVISTMIYSTKLLFGRMIINPIEIFSMVGNDFVVAIGMFIVITATITVNIAGNLITSAFDFSTCAPRKISFRTGAMITAIGSVLLTPWNLFQSPTLIHFTLNLLTSFIGPLFGILIADFYLIKHNKVFIKDLFNAKPKGIYWYKNGFNPKAIIALIVSSGICLIIVCIPRLNLIMNFNWFIGVIFSIGTYYYLVKKN